MIDFDHLKYEASISKNKRSRIIMVPGFDMVICLHKSSRVGMHRHPSYEAYHLLEGVLLVDFPGDDPITLSVNNPIMHIPAKSWHEPFAQSEFAIYREFYCGPFEKERDVEYMRAAA